MIIYNTLGMGGFILEYIWGGVLWEFYTILYLKVCLWLVLLPITYGGVW